LLSDGAFGNFQFVCLIVFKIIVYDSFVS